MPMEREIESLNVKKMNQREKKKKKTFLCWEEYGIFFCFGNGLVFCSQRKQQKVMLYIFTWSDWQYDKIS